MRTDPSPILEGLNPEQAEAVSHGDGPILVLAGAGSGKTRVLTRRLAWLVARGVPQESLVALTFTNKAAGEMKERVAHLLGSDRPRCFVGTFHSFGVRLLRRFHAEAGLDRAFVVMDQDDQVAIVKAAMKAAGTHDASFTPRSVLSLLSRARNLGWAPSEHRRHLGDYRGAVVEGLHKAYEKALREAQALDFDDLLLRPVRLLTENATVLERVRASARHLLVDEYQDTNGVQAELVRLLAGETRNVFAVGDEDQSIYRWRGADVENILDFRKDFPGARIVALERNYRSTAPILEAAGAVVAENQRRHGKKLRAVRPGGEPVSLLVLDEERDEAREVVSRISALRRKRPEAQAAVLFRTNAQSRPFEEELVRARIPYLLVGGTRFYERAEVKDALAYLRLVRNPADDISFRRVVNVPARGVGAATLEALTGAAEERGVSLSTVLQDLPVSLTERARRALTEFRELLARLAEEAAAAGWRTGAVVDAVVEESGLYALFAGSADPQDQARRENLDELRAAGREHERAGLAEGEDDSTLAGFLDALTLRSDADDVDDRRGVLLMTLHSAKGLEFEEVYLAGFEDGSLPHSSARNEEAELEEERRLAYVGMTRAKERLTLSRVRRRMVRGEWMARDASPFLEAIPRRLLKEEDLTGAGGLFASGGPGAPARREWLFPDYEGESQEPGRAPSRPSRTPARPPARPPTGPTMRRTPPPPTASGLRRGARVRHPDYGSGVVLTIEGSGDAEKLTVYFDRAGRKKFLSRFSNLSPA